MKWPEQLINEGKEILETIDFSISTPSKNNVLRFFDFDPSAIKVVIVGQDPYPTEGVANGIAFAVNNDVKIPASLKNIFNEIIEVQGFLKTDRTLEHWEKQGVLLINRSLTTIIGKPNSHKNIWSDFTISVIKWIDQNIDNVSWILWGNDAIKVKEYIENKTSKIIEDAHPSPLSNYKRNKKTFDIMLKTKDIVW